jgi:hypothetical protein
MLVVSSLIFRAACGYFFISLIGRDELPTTPSLRRGQLHDFEEPCDEGASKRSDGGLLIRVLLPAPAFPGRLLDCEYAACKEDAKTTYFASGPVALCGGSCAHATPLPVT